MKTIRDLLEKADGTRIANEKMRQLEHNKPRVDQLVSDYKSGKLKIDKNDFEQLSNAINAYSIGTENSSMNHTEASPYSNLVQGGMYAKYVKSELDKADGKTPESTVGVYEQLVPESFGAAYNKEGYFEPESIEGAGGEIHGVTQSKVDKNIKKNVDKSFDIQDDIKFLRSLERNNPEIVDMALRVIGGRMGKGSPEDIRTKFEREGFPNEGTYNSYSPSIISRAAKALRDADGYNAMAYEVMSRKRK